MILLVQLIALAVVGLVNLAAGLRWWGRGRRAAALLALTVAAASAGTMVLVNYLATRPGPCEPTPWAPEATYLCDGSS